MSSPYNRSNWAKLVFCMLLISTVLGTIVGLIIGLILSSVMVGTTTGVIAGVYSTHTLFTGWDSQ